MLKTRYFRILLCLSLLLLCCRSELYAQPRTLSLNNGLTVELSAANAETKPEAFVFNGVKGEYVELDCRQDGCDVRLHIFSPNKEPIATIDNFNGPYGPERWRGILAENGSYLINVEYVSVRGKQPKYQIKLIEQRAANDHDRVKAQAQDLYCQAWLRRQAGAQRDVEEAYYIYENAIDLYRRANDTLGEAQALESQAALGSPTLTVRLRIELYQSALALFHRLKEPSGEATTLHNLGAIFAEHHKNNDAIAFYQKALAVHRELGDRRNEAIALNNIAIVYLQMELPQEALRYYQQSLSACRAAGDHTNEANLLKYIADLYQQLGEKKIAERYYKEATMVK